MEKLFELDFLKKFRNFELWSDNGPHFKNQMLIYYYHYLLKRPNIDSFNLNFFVENYGKNECDRFFGVLTRYYNEFLKSSDTPITCAKDLANYFDTKKSDENDKSYSFENLVLEKYKLNKVENYIKIDNFKKYYSFVFDKISEKIKVKYLLSSTITIDYINVKEY
jgi:hypothetical protein